MEVNVSRPGTSGAHTRYETTAATAEESMRVLRLRGSRRSGEAMLWPSPCSLLFKADRPRAIDVHIDYFGGAGGRAGTSFVTAGERFREGRGARRAG